MSGLPTYGFFLCLVHRDCREVYPVIQVLHPASKPIETGLDTVNLFLDLYDKTWDFSNTILPFITHPIIRTKRFILKSLSAIGLILQMNQHRNIYCIELCNI
jgi:hypothetical protein